MSTEMVRLEDAPATVVPISAQEETRFLRFRFQVESEILTHPTVMENPYTKWFQKGQLDLYDLRHFTVQFSVFSNQLLIAQMMKIVNADSLESMRATKEIFANEIGVIFKKQHPEKAGSREISDAQKELEGDPDLVSTTGSVDGGTFKFQAAHYEWFLKFAAPQGLGFKDLGKRCFGTITTLYFCDEMIRLYGNEDPNIASGACFALESWSASGFWQDLEDGLMTIREKHMPELPLAFFTWHNRIEGQHAEHVRSELKSIFSKPDFDAEKFLAGGREMLDAVDVLSRGLYEDTMRARQKRALMEQDDMCRN